MCTALQHYNKQAGCKAVILTGRKKVKYESGTII